MGSGKSNSVGHRTAHLGRDPVGWRRLLPWGLSGVVACLVGSSCGTTIAHLVITAPASAVSGSSFTITVPAMAGQSRDTIFNNDVRFTSSDGAAILPLTYAFTAADAGSHTFTNGVTLMTAGNQTITATVTVASSITGRH